METVSRRSNADTRCNSPLARRADTASDALEWWMIVPTAFKESIALIEREVDVS